MSNQPTRTCEKCGGTITADEIIRRQAGLVGGKLLCVDCVDEIRRQHAMSRSGVIRQAAQAAGDAVHVAPRAAPPAGGSSTNVTAAAAPAAAPPGGDDAITLSAGEEAAGAPAAHEPSRKITSFAESGLGVALKADHAYRRELAPRDKGATRCKTFHAKLTDPAIAYMDSQINDWIDAHPDVYIKFSTSAMGVFEGKHSEQHLIVTIFY